MSTGIIFAHARSGSSELARALRDATRQPLLLEPFHKSMRKQGVEFVSPEFPNYLDQVMTTPLVKHMWNGISMDDNMRIISHSRVSGIVFLYRRDVMRAALSAVVANITGEWRGGVESFNKPLPLDKVEKRARVISRGQRKYRQQLADIGKPYLCVAYEDLYSMSLERQVDMIHCICAIFGHNIVDAMAGVKRLRPEKRYHSEEFYRSAPNWNEFEARLLSRS